MGLVTIQQIKNSTSIGGNVDADKLHHLIDDAEALVLEPALGTALYNKIVTDFNEGGTNNLSGNYLTLYNNYIIKILCYTVYADYLRDGFILAQNTGIFQNTPDDKGGADLSDVQFVAKQNKSKADVYLERMERFLCDKNITEYNSAQENTYDIDPREVNSISGWYLPRSNSYEEGKIIINTGTGTNTDGLLELQDE